MHVHPPGTPILRLAAAATPIGELAFPDKLAQTKRPPDSPGGRLNAKATRCYLPRFAGLLDSSIRASAWWMLPLARFVFTTDFWPATRVTSVSKLWYPGNSTLILCVPGLSSME